MKDQDISWEEIEGYISSNVVSVIPDTGVYLSTTASKVPQALAAQVKNLHSCPENIIIVTVTEGDIPYVTAKPQVKVVNERVRQVYVWVGFMQEVNIQKTLIEHVMSIESESKCTYYLADRKFIESKDGNLGGLTGEVFSILHRNSATASSYFGLPEDRVITLGTQMDL